MIKEEIIKKLIKDKNYAEYLCAVNLSEYDVATLVCHAPVSLFEKQSIYKELIAERPRERVPSDERFVYENYLRAAVRATEDSKVCRSEVTARRKNICAKFWAAAKKILGIRLKNG